VGASATPISGRLQQAGFSEAEIAEIVANVAIKPSN